MEPFVTLKSIAAPLPMINVDTDMIIPKQFLKTIKRSGLGKNLFHHPSGTLRPSESDKSLTQKIKKAGDLLDIKVLDHLIISPDGDYYSFADNGIL